MSILSLLGDYLAKHARNIEADTVAHLRAFAAHAEASLAKGYEDVKEDATQAVSYVETEADKVKLAAEALSQHAEGSFEKLLEAESTPTPESK